ncbi:MAG: aspartate kinase [Deltaproteobacteria bacterium]|nr:aspartate kinase [Deltaproteobacteria bacterium]
MSNVPDTRPIVVHKYGGSSVADLDKIRLVARRIADTVAQGYRVCAVVSAMGKTTDGLLKQAKELSANPNPRELDMLLSTGERVSVSLLAIALSELGLDAVSFTGSQSGIITNTRHNRARIVEVRPFRLLDELDHGKVVVVAGYQGVSYAREITTLGRGGTDTTAVALAAALGAEHCEICSDVDGVYTADPRLAPDAKRLPEVGHDEMIALARAGSKVLAQDCVEHAARHGVAIFAKATAGPRDDAGTVVRQNPAREPRLVTAIAHRLQMLEVALPAGHDLGALLEVLTRVNALPHEVIGGGQRPLHAFIPTENCHRPDLLKRALAERFGADAALRDDRGSVTLVGPGLGEAPDVTLRATGLVRELVGGPPEVVLSSLSLGFILPRDLVAPAVARLHAALFG